MSTPSPATESTADPAEFAESLSCPPQTGRLHNSFQYLRAQIIQHEKNLPGDIRRKCKWAVDQFLRRFDVEVEHFNGTLSDLADSYRTVDESDWRTIERSIRARCGAYYGKYLDLVNQMLATVRGIAELAGVAEDTAPWLQQDVPHGAESAPATPPSSAPVSPRNSSWNTFILAICSVNGSLGGQVDVHLTAIWEANDRLNGIRNRVQDASNRLPSRQLEAFRQHAERAATILGHQNGFSCSHESHGAFIQIKKCFRDHEPGSEDQSWDEICSLVFHNSVPDVTIPWTWMEMTSETMHCPPPDQMNVEDTQSLKTPSLKSSLRKAVKALRFESTSTSDKVNKNRRVDRPKNSSSVTLSSDPNIGLCSFLSSLTNSEEFGYPNGIMLSRQDTEYQLRLHADRMASPLKTQGQSPVSIRTRYSSSDFPALSIEAKLDLAIKLTSGILYLHSTPWLAQSWDTEDIYLISESGTYELGGLLLGKRPQVQTCRGPSDNRQTDRPTNTDLTISRLGRFLVELWCGASWNRIQDTFLPPSTDRPKMESDAEILVITHILTWAANPTVAEKDRPFYLEGNSYADAVRSCFLCDFGQQTTSMEDEDFRSGVFLRILRPLQYALDDFYTSQSRIYGAKKNQDDMSFSHGSQEPQSMQDLRLFDDANLDPDSQSKINSADKWLQDYADVRRIGQTIRQRPESPRDRIRVAILDTGVDVSEHFLHRFYLKGQIIYADFLPGGSSSKIPQDDHGHGTYITSILLKIAKNADVYVARVSKDGKQPWNSSCVEKALQWAIQQEVHIISISFGFPRIDQSLEPIRRGILQAHAADILVFAAASNIGKGHPIAFPACLDEVICVSSTDGAGQPSVFNPTIQPGKRLCAIGEGLEGSWPLKFNPKGGTLWSWIVSGRSEESAAMRRKCYGVTAECLPYLISCSPKARV
ncbi:hypothetical protein FB567DRAFT_585915 [Paraphoma chrysanthemicola]|uniref:Peptidase S8/S53 domain-containing protein n=1 Tax=Paraphoma chrysanthemicola TaxID=798071 RepID=A0A8K0RIT7_9PLEO|nr:hypothetical protein FB567DRAFT_585915 [Paraphoma chrysanthemicola]